MWPFGRKENSKLRDVETQVGAQLGSAMSANFQRGTDIAHVGMDLFRSKGARLTKVNWEQGKGNLFEFIEGAKLQRNLANEGQPLLDKFPVTDVPASKGGFGEHTAPDDFRLVREGKVISSGQAKVNNDPHKTAGNFTKSKYDGMQRNTTIDSVPAIRNELKLMLDKGEISKDTYEEVCKNLKGPLTDPETGITSGGTTRKELEQFRGKDGKISAQKVESYARRFEYKQYCREIGKTTMNSALYGAGISGIFSATTNLFTVLQDKKTLEQALKDIGVDAVKGSARAGAIGFFSSLIRIGGSKAKVPIISDGSAATAIAGGVIEGGVAIYEYVKGEISEEELSRALGDTLIKSTATIYYTKALGAMFASSALVPIVAFSVSSYIVTITREIMTNAKLKAEEHRRATRLNEMALEQARAFRQKVERQIKEYEYQQRLALNGFLDTFEYNLKTGENYDSAIYAIVNFATQTGIALQHADFKDFSNAMNSDAPLVLK